MCPKTSSIVLLTHYFIWEFTVNSKTTENIKTVMQLKKSAIIGIKNIVLPKTGAKKAQQSLTVLPYSPTKPKSQCNEKQCGEASLMTSYAADVAVRKLK